MTIDDATLDRCRARVNEPVLISYRKKGNPEVFAYGLLKGVSKETINFQGDQLGPNTSKEEGQISFDNLLMVVALKDVKEVLFVSSESIMIPYKKRLPSKRAGEHHDFSIDGRELRLFISLDSKKRPIEIYITMPKAGALTSGLLIDFSEAISRLLQMGVPVLDLSKSYIERQYEPSGKTNNPDIADATSVTDYVFQYLELNYSNAYSHYETKESLHHENNVVNNNPPS